jgi:hypothetical protein
MVKRDKERANLIAKSIDDRRKSMVKLMRISKERNSLPGSVM